MQRQKGVLEPDVWHSCPPAGQEVGVGVLHRASLIPHTPLMRLGMSVPEPSVFQLFFCFIKLRFHWNKEVV